MSARTDPVAGAGGAARTDAAAAASGVSGAAGAPAADRPEPVVLRVAAGVLVAVAAAGLALVEAFLVPLRIGSVPLPVCVLLALVGNAGLARLAGRVTGSVVGAAVPPVLWLVVVLVLSVPRAEGDLIVPGTLTGLVFLFAGAVAGAYGIASTITRRTRPPRPSRG